MSPIGTGPADPHENVSVSTTAQALDQTIRRMVVTGFVSAQVILVLAILTLGFSTRTGIALGLIALLIALILTSLRRPQVMLLVVPGLYGLSVLNFWMIDSLDTPLGAATVWLVNMTNLVLPFTLRSRVALVLSLAAPNVAAIVVMLTAVPDVAVIGPSMMFTATVMVVAATVGVTALRRWGDRASRSSMQLAEQRARNDMESLVSAQSAEDARVLHDTVVNTLAVIASGSAVTRDVELVRTRCQRDVDILTQRFIDLDDSSTDSLTEVTGHHEGVRVRRTGMTDEDLLRTESLMDPHVVHAAVGATNELIRNARHHGGVEVVDVDISPRESTLVITVTDEGRGFDGQVVPGRGLAESVVARMADVGGSVRVDSRPGAGTRAHVIVPWGAAGDSRTVPTPTRRSSESSTIERIQWWSSWFWAVGVVVVGTLLALFNNWGDLIWTYVMLAIVAAVSGIAVLAKRFWGSVPVPVLVVMILALPVAYVAGVAAMSFGAEDTALYQAIGVSPLVILPLAAGGERWFVAAVTTYAGTVLTTIALVGWSQSWDQALVVFVLACPLLLVVAMWWGFHHFVASTIHQLVANRDETLRLRAHLEASEELAVRRTRWWQAGLRAAMQTLSRISTGQDDPRDPAVRDRCAADEQYLRELTVLNTRLTLLSPWVVQSMVEARNRSVTLSLRIGDDVDAPDSVAARMLGPLVLGRVESATDGAPVTVGLFEHGGRSHLLLVGPPWQPGRLDLPDRFQVRHEHLGDQDLLEVTWGVDDRTPGVGNNETVLLVG